MLSHSPCDAYTSRTKSFTGNYKYLSNILGITVSNNKRLGAIFCWGFKESLVCGELLGLVSELELHKHFIWPLLIYAQNRILLLDAGFCLFVWRGDSLRPDNHETSPFILTSRSFPQASYLSWTLQMDANTTERLERQMGCRLASTWYIIHAHAVEPVGMCIDNHSSLRDRLSVKLKTCTGERLQET